jgi:PAS domain S-box-containing protein
MPNLTTFLASLVGLPHGACLLWEAGLVWLHVLADAGIALAYYAIPLSLVSFVRRRQDLAFHWMFWLFGAFIFACGTTHLMRIWTLWQPVYGLEGLIKVVTASVSLTTAALLIPLVPKALALPSPAQLEAANRALQREVAEREQAEAALRTLNAELDRRVQERTAALQAEIAERRQADQALRASEERFRVMAETAADAILIIDAASTIRFANPAAERLFGYRVAELLGQPLTMLMPPELRDEHRRGLSRYLETGERHVPRDHMEFPGRHHSGTEVALEIAFGEFQQHDERLFAGIIRDITARKRTEDDLRRAAALLELTHEAILVLDLDETIRFWNPGATEMYGWFPEEALGQVAYRLLETRFPKPLEAIKVELLRSTRWEGDLAQTRRDGSTLVVASRWALQRDADGQPLAFLEINSDITARRRAEASLAASETQLRLVTDSAPVFLAHCDAEGRYRFVNRGYAERLGLRREEVIGRRIPEVLGAEAYASFRAYVERVLAGEPVEFEVEVPYQTIGPRWMHCAYVPERDAAGAVHGHIAVVTDVTARKRMETQLEASLHEKEVLLKEIHHRVKNNFQVISSFLSLQSRFIEAPPLHAIFEECQNRIYAMALVHQNLYQAENLASIDFGAYLESLGAYLLRSYGVDPQRIQFISTGEHVFLTIDTAVPCGLLINELVSNALRHAFPPGQAGHLWVTLRQEVDSQLRLNVRDDGVGLPEGMDFRTTSSFGMRLVGLLAQQLRATMTLERHPGTSVTLTFTEPTYQARS